MSGAQTSRKFMFTDAGERRVSSPIGGGEKKSERVCAGGANGDMLIRTRVAAADAVMTVS